MRVLQDLFTIVSEKKEGDHYIVQVIPMMDSEIYKAHFPGNPITPGVCLIQAVGEIIEKMTKRTVTLVQIKNVKFLSMVVPHDNIATYFDIQMNWKDNSAKATVTTESIVCAKMSLVYHEV